MRFVAVDWGTTNRRVYVIENGIVISSERDDRGVGRIAQGAFDAEVEALCARYDGMPMLLAGMIGSDRGWIDAGYLSVPASLDQVAAAVKRPRGGVAVVPGLSFVKNRVGNVMRGEEVQLLGAAAGGLVPSDALLCQPGTHSKWATMANGAITGFTTAMTGEMFALLRQHALIGREMVDDLGDHDAFLDGVADAARGDLLSALFSVRPARLLGLRPQASLSSYVSGLLIGSDCRARVSGGETIHLLADATIGESYARAIAAVGGRAVLIDSQSAFVAGISRIQERLV